MKLLMATQTETDASAPPISVQIERDLHDFVRDAVSNLPEALKDSGGQFEYGTRWERGADGNFREQRLRAKRTDADPDADGIEVLDEYDRRR
jgi:hypothetical protein